MATTTELALRWDGLPQHIQQGIIDIAVSDLNYGYIHGYNTQRFLMISAFVKIGGHRYGKLSCKLTRECVTFLRDFLGVEVHTSKTKPGKGPAQ